MRETPWTQAESSALPPETKDAMLREAKPGTWYDGWRPYCGQEQTYCSMPRMVQEPYGFRCPECGNMIAWDLTRIAESPLNRKPEGEPLQRMSGNADQEQRILRGIERYRDQHYPTCIITDIGHSHIAEAIRGAGFPVLTLDDDLRHMGIESITVSPPCDHFAGFSDRSYMKPQRSETFIVRGDPDPVEHHRAPDDNDGRPTHHRRQRKMKKRSRQINRRK